MKAINILDCTLRDGGYVNNWNFPTRTIRKILPKLLSSNVDVIECGYLNQYSPDENESTMFRTIEGFAKKIEELTIDSSRIALMINYGEYRLSDLPKWKEGFPKIIRLAFHKEKWREALTECNTIVEKGYILFLQPMITLRYTDSEALELIEMINQINPNTTYIVDSFGEMHKNDVQRLTTLFDHNLNPKISLGFHAHNSLQLAYSNSITFIETVSGTRECYIDASIFGMGRGAGNLCTELLASYLSENYSKPYTITPLLEIMDEYLIPIYTRHAWGYSPAYYLSATHRCHPNYSSHLLEKQSLTISSINECLQLIPNDKKNKYDKELIESIYINYQTRTLDDSEAKENIRQQIKCQNILLLGPGKTIRSEYHDVMDYIRKYNPYIISVNFIPETITPNIVFVSNRKRFNSMEKLPKECIFTSNIVERPQDSTVINYASLLNNYEGMSDNALLLLLKLLIELDTKEVALAGFDGYSRDVFENYYNESYVSKTDESILCSRNRVISAALTEYSLMMKIRFITTSRYKIYTRSNTKK